MEANGIKTRLYMMNGIGNDNNNYVGHMYQVVIPPV